MGNLPVSRTETCVPGAPVNPNLMNEIQDNIVAGLHASRPLVLSASQGNASTGWSFGAAGIGALPSATCTVAGTVLPVHFPLREGEQVDSVTFRAYGNGTTSTLIARVKVCDGSDVTTTIGTRTLAAGGGGLTAAYQTFTVTGLTPTIIPAGGAAWIEFDTGATTAATISRIVVANSKTS